MRVFYYDRKMIAAIKVANTIDAIELIAIDGFLALVLFKQIINPFHERNFFYNLLLFAVGVYFLFSFLIIFSKFLNIHNLKQEKLEIFQDGLAMTFVERLQNGESLRNIYLPWEEIRYAELIQAEQISVKNLRLSNLFKFREEYKTIEIHTDKRIYKLFIEYSIDAVDIINRKGKPL